MQSPLGKPKVCGTFYIQDICDKTAILLINFQVSNTLFYLNEIVDGSVMILKRYWILDNLNSDFKGRLLNKTDYLKWLITSGNAYISLPMVAKLCSESVLRSSNPDPELVFPAYTKVSLSDFLWDYQMENAVLANYT